jgi:hypothetical protein
LTGIYYPSVILSIRLFPEIQSGEILLASTFDGKQNALSIPGHLAPFSISRFVNIFSLLPSISRCAQFPNHHLAIS